MTAILGTLPFIATLWLVLAVGAAILEESGAKILTALRGEALQQPSTEAGGRRDRKTMRTRAPSRETVPLRAAA